MISDDEMRIMRLEARVKELQDEVERLKSEGRQCRHKIVVRDGATATCSDCGIWIGGR